MAGRVDWLIFHGFCYFKNPLLACYQSAVCETAFSLTTLQRATAVIVFRGNAGIFVGGLLIMINVFNVL